MRFYNRIISFVSVIAFSLYFLPLKTFAACAAGEIDLDIVCVPNTPAGFTSVLYGVGLGLIGGVSVLYIILGGYFILTSQGDQSKLATGKSYITYAIIGLLLAIFGYIFIEIIAVDILRIPGFN